MLNSSASTSTEAISLRDEIAIRAMQGYLANAWQAQTLDETGDSSGEQMRLIAECSYHMADAMLKAKHVV